MLRERLLHTESLMSDESLLADADQFFVGFQRSEDIANPLAQMPDPSSEDE